MTDDLASIVASEKLLLSRRIDQDWLDLSREVSDRADPRSIVAIANRLAFAIGQQRAFHYYISRRSSGIGHEETMTACLLEAVRCAQLSGSSTERAGTKRENAGFASGVQQIARWLR